MIQRVIVKPIAAVSVIVRWNVVVIRPVLAKTIVIRYVHAMRTVHVIWFAPAISTACATGIAIRSVVVIPHANVMMSVCANIIHVPPNVCVSRFIKEETS